MKILHISHLYYPSVGGNQYHNQLMAEGLSALGEEVHVFTSNAVHPRQFLNQRYNKQLLPSYEMINGVHVHRFEINYGFNSFIITKLFRVRGGYRLFKMIMGNCWPMWEQGPVVKGMIKAIRDLKPDIVMVNYNYAFTTFLAYWAKRLLNFRMVFMPITHTSSDWARNLFLKKMYTVSDSIIACTDFEKKFLEQQGASRVVALPLGVPPDIFQGLNGRRVKEKYNLPDGEIVAYFGRKVHKKGLEALIDAMPLVWKEYPNAYLLLAGQAATYFAPVIKQHVNLYSWAERARLIDIDDFSEEEKKDFYDAADIVVMASNNDCFGLVYLESWLAGKPVVACKNTPQESIIRDGIDGLLVEYNNKHDLAQAIVRLLKDKNLRVKMGENGRQIVNTKYNVKTYASDLRDEYSKVLRGK